jgi:hypothetical protein
MNWFKLHAEFCWDPKVQSMTEPMQRRLIMTFGHFCSDKTAEVSDAEMACFMRISITALKKTKSLFIDKGFIDEAWNVIHWRERQSVVTPSAERMRRKRKRDRHSDADVTSHERNGDVTETSHVTLAPARLDEIREEKKIPLLPSLHPSQPQPPEASAKSKVADPSDVPEIRKGLAARNKQRREDEVK